MARLNRSESTEKSPLNARKPVKVLLPTSALINSTASQARKHVQSPCKSKRQYDDGDILTDRAQARQQRSLKLQHVDSLLLHPIAVQRDDALQERTDSRTSPVRSTPARRAKLEKTVFARDLSLDVSLTEELDDEWAQSSSHDPSGSSSESEDDYTYTFAGPNIGSKSFRLHETILKPSHRSERRVGDIVNAVSPAKAKGSAATTLPLGNVVLHNSRPSSSSSPEPFATIRLYVLPYIR